MTTHDARFHYTRAWGMCLGVVGTRAPKLLSETLQGNAVGLPYPAVSPWLYFIMSLSLLLFMFVVITPRLVAGHWIIPFAVIVIKY